MDAYPLYGEAHYRPWCQPVVAWSVGALYLFLGGLGPAIPFRSRQKSLFWLGLGLRLRGHLRRCLLTRRLRLRGLRLRGFGFLLAHRLRFLPLRSRPIGGGVVAVVLLGWLFLGGGVALRLLLGALCRNL